MRVTFSRPATGSLRATWVTPATVVLSLATAAVAVAVVVACAAGWWPGGGGGWAAAAGIVLGLLVASGSGAVGLVGAAQRHRA